MVAFENWRGEEEESDVRTLASPVMSVTVGSEKCAASGNGKKSFCCGGEKIRKRKIIISDNIIKN